MAIRRIIPVIAAVFVAIFALSGVSPVHAELDRSSTGLIRKYEEAVQSKDPARIKVAWESLKKNGTAVEYMQGNFPNLFRHYQRQAQTYAKGDPSPGAGAPVAPSSSVEQAAPAKRVGGETRTEIPSVKGNAGMEGGGSLQASPVEGSTAPDPEYDKAKRAARGRIEKYDEAVKSGNPERIRKATLEAQSDPLAVREMNQTRGNAWKKDFNERIEAVHAEGKDIARREIARKLGVSPDRVNTFEATNPPPIDPVTGEEIQKIGQDKDRTWRLDKKKDIPAEVVRQADHNAFHEAATGEKPPSREGMTETEYKRAMKGYEKRANRTAHRQSLEVLNSRGDEAYGGAASEGERMISGPKDQALRDKPQASKVIEHKSNKSANTAAEYREKGNVNRAIGHEMEQYRQSDKQIDKQVRPRVEARGGTMPEHLEKGAKIVKRVAEGELSPGQGKTELAKMGETPETIIRKNAEMVEASQTLESPGKVIERAKAGQTPPDVLPENVREQLEMKKLQRSAQVGKGASPVDASKEIAMERGTSGEGPGMLKKEPGGAAGAAEPSAGKTRTPSLLDGGKASAQPPTIGQRVAGADRAVGGKMMEVIGVGEVPESAGGFRKSANVAGDKTMAAVAVAATAHEGFQAGHEMGEGMIAAGKAGDYREQARKAREAGNEAIADKMDKRAAEYEAEGSEKGSKGAKDAAVLVGTLAVAGTATGGAALAGYGAYKTGEASYGAGKDLSQRMIDEEYAREVAAAQKEGRAPNEGAARANAIARIAGEVTMVRAGMERAMRDTEADRAAEEMDRKLKDRRDTELLALDDGLHEIAGIERRLRDLDKNPNQDDPWVRQRREELLGQYDAKRREMQGVNNRLGREAGRENPEFIAVRQAVSLLPEKSEGGGVLRDPDGAAPPSADLGPGSDEGDFKDLTTGGAADDGSADLADLMVRHGDRGGGAGGRDESSGTARLVEEYSGAPSSGQSDRGGGVGTIGGDPSSGDVSDLAVLAKASREETLQQEGRKTQDKRTDRQASEDQWGKTLSRMEADRQKQEDRIADLLKKKQEIAAQMIAQAGRQDGGMLSGSEFVDRMNELERDYQRESQVMDDMLTRIASERSASGVSPGSSSAAGGGSGVPGGCENNFSLNADSTLFCKCPGYKFDYSRVRCVPGPGAAGAGSVASSGPGGAVPVDTRTVQCSTTTKSGGDAPAQITVNLGSSVGTARFSYDMYTVKDRMIVSYGGSTILDTGCVGGKGSTPISLTGGSSQVTVVVRPACETKGTSWNFRVECP